MDNPTAVSAPGAFRHLPGALRLLRDRQGITQRRLAERAECTLKQISAYETARQRPRIETLERVLAVLDADVSDLARAMEGLAAVERGGLRDRPTASGFAGGAAPPVASGRTLREISERLPQLQGLADELLLDILADALENRARVVARDLRAGAVPARVGDGGEEGS